MAGFLIGRAGFDDLVTGPTNQDRTRYNEARDWLASLGLDVNRLVPTLLVEQLGDEYVLHLAELVAGGDGRPLLNLATDAPEVRAVRVPVAADTWPAWLTGLNCELATR